MKVQEAVVVLFDAELIDQLSEVPRQEPIYLTLSGINGLYEIPFVATDKQYHLLAYIDDDTDAEYDDGEIVGCHPGVVAFGEVPELTDLDVLLCGETLCGSISGRVDTSSVADTLRTVVAVRSGSDSALTYDAVVNRGGEFRIECVKPGSYLVAAFVDFNGNQRRDPEDTIFVELGDTLSVESCLRPPQVEIILGHED